MEMIRLWSDIDTACCVLTIRGNESFVMWSPSFWDQQNTDLRWPTPKPKKKDETSVHQEVESEISMSRSFSNWYYLANLFNSSPNLKYCYLGWLPSYTIAITSVTSPSLCRSTCRSKSDAQLRWDKSPRCSCGTEWLKWIEIGGSLGSFKVWKWVIPCDTQSLYHFMPFVWLKLMIRNRISSNLVLFLANPCQLWRLNGAPIVTWRATLIYLRLTMLRRIGDSDCIATRRNSLNFTRCHEYWAKSSIDWVRCMYQEPVPWPQKLR